MIPQGYTNFIIIDEIQRIPELLNEIHRLIESKKYRFVITSSNIYNLRKQGVNLLGGRALRYNMHPLTVQEIGVMPFVETLQKLPEQLSSYQP